MWQGFRGLMRHRDARWSKLAKKMPHKMPVNATFITHFSGMLRLQQIVQYGIAKKSKNNAKNPLTVGITYCQGV